MGCERPSTNFYKFMQIIQYNAHERSCDNNALQFSLHTDENYTTTNIDFKCPMSNLNLHASIFRFFPHFRTIGYAQIGIKKWHVDPSRLLRMRSTFIRSVMVSVAISKMGMTELIFWRPWNEGELPVLAYRDVLLSQQILPAIKRVAGVSTRQRSGVSSRILTCTELKGHCFVLVSGYVC